MLGFLEMAHTSFGILAFAVGSVLSAQAAFQIAYEGARINVFQTPVIVVLVVMLVLFLGPLLIFTPAMAHTRRHALRSYGSLVTRYNSSFHEKWIESRGPQDEPLLGNADIQSLADLGSSFRLVADMGLTPFGRRAVLLLTLATVLPGVPLLLLVFPISDIIDALAKVVL